MSFDIFHWHQAAAVAEGLKPRETRVLYLMATHADNDTGEMWPSVGSIARRLRISERDVGGSKGDIASLVRKGWLTKVRDANRHEPAHYRLSVGRTIVPEVCGDTPREVCGDTPRGSTDGLDPRETRGSTDGLDPRETRGSTDVEGSEFFTSRGPSSSHLDPRETRGRTTHRTTQLTSSCETPAIDAQSQRDADAPEADAHAPEADAAASEAKFFEEFKSNYPQHRLGAHPHLLKAAFRKALGKTKGQVILEGLAWQVAEWRKLGTDTTQVPWAGKWLADELWTVERPAPTPAPPKRPIWEVNGYDTEAEWDAWRAELDRRQARREAGRCDWGDGRAVCDEPAEPGRLVCVGHDSGARRMVAEAAEAAGRPDLAPAAVRAAANGMRHRVPESWLSVPAPAAPAAPTEPLDPFAVPASWAATA